MPQGGPSAATRGLEGLPAHATLAHLMVLRLDHRVLGELDGRCPSCGEERSLRRHAVRPAWLAAAIFFPNPELLVCERCSGVSRQESVLDRALGALLLALFLLVLVGGGATGAWILWGLLATGRPDWGFLALGAGLVAVAALAALAGRRAARGLANLLGPRRMLPMAGLSVDLGAAPRGSPHRADAWLTPHPALSLFWTAVAPAALPELFAVVASASEGRLGDAEVRELATGARATRVGARSAYRFGRPGLAAFSELWVAWVREAGDVYVVGVLADARFEERARAAIEALGRPVPAEDARVSER